MVNVQTVLGPVPAQELGRTLIHEHILIGWYGWQDDSTVAFDRAAAIARAAEQMAELRSLGISTLVDPCPIDLGRDVELLAEVSRRSGLNIVCATGLYHEEMGLPPYFRLREVEELTEIFCRELQEGVGRTGIRPGIIKCATGPHEVGPHEEKVLRAAARAHLATGVPILTHTSGGRLGPEQLDILLAEGVQPSSVLIGHCCANANLSYHLELLQRGCAIGIDQIGLEFLMPDQVRLAITASLCQLGWAQRLFVSQDHVSCYPGRFIKLPPEIMVALAKRTYTYLLTDWLPRLQQEFQVPASTVETLLVDNPRRLFEQAQANAQGRPPSGAAGRGAEGEARP
jgi:phosphotriesterase-related protein